MNGIKKIQEYLSQNNYDAYVIFSSDDHGSEYIDDYFKMRDYFSGFTGSNGTMVITKTDSYVWTDGRYFIQAKEQLKKTGTILMKMDEKGYPTIYEFIASLGIEPVICFDYKIATINFVSYVLLKNSKVKFVNESLLIDKIWTDRPQKVKSKAYLLPDNAAGENIGDKITRVKEKILKKGYKNLLITSLDDIAWLFNMRGNDIKYNPVNYAYALITSEQTSLYIDLTKLNSQDVSVLSKNNVVIKNYEDIYSDVKNIDGKVLIDARSTNYMLYANIKNKDMVTVSPICELKAIKNPTEIKNIKKAHIEDAVAMIKFHKYLKENVGKIYMDELTLENILLNFRKENPDFTDLSFDTICGYESNGAIIHYSATPETNKIVKNKGFLLVDSGAQYNFGTTDITRTYALGEITKEMKKHYTLVLKSHIALSDAIFIEGTTGANLDMLSRECLYREFIEFKHGTGHGVGYFLNVHEGPQNISIRNKTNVYPMCEGMVTSDEPGIYIENNYGIRLENLILCKKIKSNDYGNFYGFEPLTLVPFDIDAIDVDMLTDVEKTWINNYNKLIKENVSCYLDEDLKNYLNEITKQL